jgi:peptide/nickel transport system permease protein
MTSYIIRRLAFGVVLIFLATILSFSLLKLSPGSAIVSDDPRVSKEYIEQQNKVFGFDRPAWRQYLSWLGGLFTWDFGKSTRFRQDVTTVIGSHLWATLMLNLIALALTWAVAVPLGTFAAVNQYKATDKVVTLFSFIGMSLPGFFMALVMLWLFASKVQWLPPGGLRGLDHEKMSTWGKMVDLAHHLIIPVVVLTFNALASLQRITRANMLETLRMQYVVTARAKGVPERTVIFRHALRNAINPLITLLGFEFAGLFAGAALLEVVLNYPGMGLLLLDALRSKDQFLVMGIFLIGSVMLVMGNLLGELLLAWIDPRVSHG